MEDKEDVGSRHYVATSHVWGKNYMRSLFLILLGWSPFVSVGTAALGPFQTLTTSHSPTMRRLDDPTVVKPDRQ